MGARLAKLLTEPTDWTIYASPLGRARQTAERVCQQLGLDQERIIWDERLVELGMGEWEGRRVPELLAAHPELDLEEPDWYLRAPMARVLRAFSAGPGNGLRTSTLPSRPSWFLTVSLAPCCAAPMWIWTTPPPGCRSCRKMPSSNSAVAASSGLPADPDQHGSPLASRFLFSRLANGQFCCILPHKWRHRGH